MGKAGASSPQNGSAARYFPFGDWRSEPAQTITSLGYTGHRHNNLAANDLGLIYMNARYYLSGLGRFASPDTLVPDPANPQAFNRYSYSLNNPIRYTDPTGRLTEEEINNYFGFQTQQDMIDAGWLEALARWLWDEDTTWGEAFASDSGVAMLVLYETERAFSGRYAGGFYWVSGEFSGQMVDPSQANTFDSQAASADVLETRYQNRWEKLPARLGTDGKPYWEATTYVDSLTRGTVLAGGSLLGGGLLLACVVAEPCGVLIAGGTILTGASAVSAVLTIYGTYTTIDDILSPDVSLANYYPVLTVPSTNVLGQMNSRNQRTHHVMAPKGAYQR